MGAAGQRQYARNRQLIAALIANDTVQALALVNAEADPNTRYDPPPTPTFSRLLNRLLHPAPDPANATLTAFMLACGRRYQYREYSEQEMQNHPEALPLVQVMLAHGADIHFALRRRHHGAFQRGFDEPSGRGRDVVDAWRRR